MCAKQTIILIEEGKGSWVNFITLLVHLVNFSLPFIPNYINHSINNGCASHPVISYISVSASYQHPVCKVGNLEMHY